MSSYKWTKDLTDKSNNQYDYLFDLRNYYNHSQPNTVKYNVLKYFYDKRQYAMDTLRNYNIDAYDVIDYMIENKCEDLPIEWVVNLISPSR